MPSRVLLPATRALNLIRRVRWALRGRREQARSATRILFLQFEPFLGWAVHATPVFEAVKAGDRNRHVVVAHFSPIFEVVKNSPFVDRLIRVPDPRRDFFGALRQLRRIVCEEAIECVVTTDPNSSGRFVILAALLLPEFLVGVSKVDGLYDIRVPYDDGRSVIENNLDIARALGATVSPSEPRVFSDRQAVEVARSLLAGRDAGRATILMVTQTSGGNPTDWWPDRFAEVADSLARDGARIVFVGTPKDQAKIDEILSMMKEPAVSLAGCTSLPELVAVVAQSDLAVTVDTGVLHVAWAVGLPTIVIAAAWQPKHTWLPLGRPFMTVLRRDDISCRECLKHFCATRECLDEIPASAVVAAARDALVRFPPSAEARHERARRLLGARESIGAETGPPRASAAAAA